MEKVASIFAFYIIGCIISLIVLVMENIFRPKLAWPNESTDEINLSRKINALVNELDAFTDNEVVKLFLWNEVKSRILKKM